MDQAKSPIFPTAGSAAAVWLPEGMLYRCIVQFSWSAEQKTSALLRQFRYNAIQYKLQFSCPVIHNNRLTVHYKCQWADFEVKAMLEDAVWVLSGKRNGSRRVLTNEADCYRHLDHKLRMHVCRTRFLSDRQWRIWLSMTVVDVVEDRWCRQWRGRRDTEQNSDGKCCACDSDFNWYPTELL